MAAATRDELLAEAQTRGLDVPEDATKQQIQDALTKFGPTPEAAAQDAAQGASQDDGVERFPAERLIADSIEFLDCPSHEAAGALSALSQKEFGIAEARAIVSTWRTGKVQEVQI